MVRCYLLHVSLSFMLAGTTRAYSPQELYWLLGPALTHLVSLERALQKLRGPWASGQRVQLSSRRQDAFHGGIPKAGSCKVWGKVMNF